MALQITVNGTTTLDESEGLQNTGIPNGDLEDNNDNDVALSSLPEAFATILTTAGVDLSDDSFAATAGVAVSADNFISTNQTSELSFSFTDGGPTGLSATDGGAITYEAVPGNDDVVLLVDTDGDVVGGLFLEQTSDTNSRVWSVLTEALNNGDPTDADEGVALANLSVTGTAETSFIFAGVKSGQQYFLTFEQNGTGLLVTSIIAEDPDDTTEILNSSNVESVNTSTQGLGSENQAFVSGQGAILTFINDVTGAVRGSDESLINYDSLLPDITAASITISQINGNPANTATITLTAYDTAKAVGSAYSEAIANDVQVDIISAEIIRNGAVIASSADLDPNFMFDNGTVEVTGLLEDDTVLYQTATAHDRVTFVNTGENAFDVLGFNLIETSAAEQPLPGVRFEDDFPTISVNVVAAADSLVVDETDLTTDATANFADNFSNTSDFGADGAGMISSSYAVATSGGASGLTDTATGEAVNLVQNGDVVEGRTATSDLLVFTVSVIAATGLVTLDQARAVVHTDATDPDDSTGLTGSNLIELTRTDTITDGDGDMASDSATIDLTPAISFRDDGPAISVDVVAAADSLEVDETDLTTDATANFADNFSNTSDFGADGAGMISSSYAVSTSGGASGLTDTATGEAVNLVQNGDVVEGRTATSNLLVFTVSVIAATGLVELDQARAVVHPDAADPDDVTGLTGTNLIELTRTDTITDGDGDMASDSATIDLTPAIGFHDDFPTLTGAPNLSVTNDPDNTGETASGQLAFDAGEDGVGGFTITEATDSGGFDWSYVDTDNIANNEIVGTGTDPVSGATFNLYSLVLNPDGSYAFTLIGEPRGTNIDLDTNDIKAGGPDTNSIVVGTLGSDSDVVIITGFGGPINESNKNVGVTNGNFDPDEGLGFEYDEDGDGVIDPLTLISIGTKTPQGFNYTYSAFLEGVEVLSGGGFVPKNGTIQIGDQQTLFDDVRISNEDGNAVKIGLDDISIQIPPDDFLIAVDAAMTDGDDDPDTLFVDDYDGDGDDDTFYVQVDANGDGIFPV